LKSGSMKPTFRIARAQDFDEVLALMRQYFAYDDISFDEPAVRLGLTELLARPELGWAFIAAESTAVVGYAVATLGFDLEFGGRQATLTDLYVDSKFRRAGIGRELLRLVERTCMSAGVRALELQAEVDNEEARAFYGANGFLEHSRIPMSKRF
jgi:ribosomal protein S18 acetylase RimI-like enzyme